MTVHGSTIQNAHDLITPFLLIIKKRLPVSEYHVESDIRSDLAELLIQYKMTMSAAESCTGGIVGKLMTDLPGSSDYFKGVLLLIGMIVKRRFSVFQKVHWKEILLLVLV